MALERGTDTIRAATATILRDLVGLAGAAAVSYGAWLVYPPAGFIAGGVLALAGVFLASWADR